MVTFIISVEGKMLVSMFDGINTGWACNNITRPVSFISKLFNGNIILLGSTVSSDILIFLSPSPHRQCALTNVKQEDIKR